MNIKSVLKKGVVLVSMLGSLPAVADNDSNARMIQRGQYMVATSGCNDCHTPGYPQADGKMPVSQWLTGSPVGFQGPWGTSYPANLRVTLSKLSAEQWLQKARTPMRPPMPWFNLRDMKDDDLLAIYQFVRSLQPIGDAAPAYAAPGVAVTTPYFDFVPKNLHMTAQASR
jgi:mono/diheme cytochrome c family protein